MKKLFFGLVLYVLACMPVLAQNLTVIRIGAPGANSDLYSTAMSAQLADRGWKTELIGFQDCKGAEHWVKNNPNKPVMYMTWSDDFVLPIIDSTHARACPLLAVNQATLVTPITKSYHMICSKDPSYTLDRLLTSEPAKIGIWNHPVQMQVLRDIVSDLKLSHRIVGFARGADLMQAVVSNDVNYIVVSSENLIRNIGGQCVLTTAPKSIAVGMSDFKTGNRQTSIESLAPKLTRLGTGLIPVYVAYNTDMQKLRNDVALILNTSPEYKNIWSSSTSKAGIVAGQSAIEQWADFDKFINSFSR